MTHPQTIQIFLPSGDPQGIRVAAITTRIVQVIEVPRARLEDFLEMPEAKYVGVYVLFGEDDETGAAKAYIGQTGNFGARLKQHNDKKDFWNRALVALSLTRSLTVTHAHFLEWMAIDRATKAQRFSLENGTEGSQPHTPSPMEAECFEVFDTVDVLLTTLGYPLFEPLMRRKNMRSEAASVASQATPVTEQCVVQWNHSTELYCRADGVEGQASYTEEGLVVLAGSYGRAEGSLAFSGSRDDVKRENLIESGAFRREGQKLIAVRDMLFKSPSPAACYLLGRAANGWIEWKDKSGRTLADVIGRNKRTEGIER